MLGERVTPLQFFLSGNVAVWVVSIFAGPFVLGGEKPSWCLRPRHSGLTSWQAHSTNPRQARNSPSTTPSSKCRSGSAATRQRSAACRSSSTVSAPTIARSLLARLTRRPGDTSFSGQGCPSAPSQPRMRLRMPSREFRSGRGVSSLMGSTTVYEEKVSDSFMASASVAVLNSATVKRWRTMRGCKPG